MTEGNTEAQGGFSQGSTGRKWGAGIGNLGRGGSSGLEEGPGRGRVLGQETDPSVGLPPPTAGPGAERSRRAI